MSIPSAEANGVFTHIYPVADLGLSTTVTGATPDTGTAFTTGCPGTIVLLSKLSSGSGSILIDRHSTAVNANFGAPDVTLTVSGTSRQVAVLDTTSSELYVSIRQTSTPNMIFAELAVFALYELTEGEDAYSVRNGINAVANDTTSPLGDGSGVVDILIA